MGYRLDAMARAAGYRLHVHDELDSTNAEALRRSREGETGPLWIVAGRQSAGRGRRGAAWLSPPGNLAATLLLGIGDVAPERVATLGFVAGLALVRALDDVCGHCPPPGGPVPEARGEGAGAANGPFRLKWPNDVLAGDAKLAGILLEAEGGAAVAVGFGVNVAAAPHGLPYPAAALRDLGYAADAPALFESLGNRFAETLRIWNKGRGFADLRGEWLKRAAGLDRPVSVRLARGPVHGRFEGIDEGGRLMILAPDGQRHTVTAGEVHFGMAATAA